MKGIQRRKLDCIGTGIADLDAVLEEGYLPIDYAHRRCVRSWEDGTDEAHRGGPRRIDCGRIFACEGDEVHGMFAERVG